MARWELVGRYALAQAAFDDAGLSWRDVWRVKSLRVGTRPLHRIPDEILEEIIQDCRKLFLKQQKK